MTHTNHRQGTYESLAKDFVVMVMPAKGYNDDADAPRKLREALSIYLAHNAVNAGAVKGGLLVTDTPEEMASVIGQDTPMITVPSITRTMSVRRSRNRKGSGLLLLSQASYRSENIAREGGLTLTASSIPSGSGKTDLQVTPMGPCTCVVTDSFPEIPRVR